MGMPRAAAILPMWSASLRSSDGDLKPGTPFSPTHWSFFCSLVIVAIRRRRRRLVEHVLSPTSKSPAGNSKRSSASLAAKLWPPSSAGADSLNTSLLSHGGSVFFIKHSQLHQVDSLSVANASSEVLITTTANHGLIIGDTFHIDDGAVVDANYTIAGIDKADLVGTHVALSVAAQVILYDTGATANADDFDDVDFLPLLQVDRYKYIDIVDDSTTWSHSTVQPTPTRSNTEEVFFS